MSVDFLYRRCDLHVLLRALNKKYILCDCNDHSKCWAVVLAFCYTFGTDPHDTYCSSDTWAEYDVTCNDEIPDETYVVSESEVKEQPLSSSGDPWALRQADVSAAGAQSSRHRPSQLIEDGLEPASHLREARCTAHPYLVESSSTTSVQLALQMFAKMRPILPRFRKEVMAIVGELAVACKEENDEIVSLADTSVRAVLRSFKCKNVCLMREINFITCPEDYSAIASLVTGLPMVGLTQPAFGLLERVKVGTSCLNEWLKDRQSRNNMVLARTGPSGDEVLDKESYSKTLQERDAGVLAGPFTDLAQLPFDDPCLVPRAGIWECHGTATAPTVRNIDDMLAGGQNSTCITTHSHRPTDVDALVAQTRAVIEACPGRRIRGWTSDFSKAYKQVPGIESQTKFAVIVQYSPILMRHVFFIPFSQLFGSRNSPLNFARFPAVFCHMVAVLLLIAASHCVDDVISVEDDESVESAKAAWDMLMDCFGWLMNVEKDSKPLPVLVVIGISLNLSPVPGSDPSVMVMAKRVKTLIAQINYILTSGVLGSGQAASLSGRLGFTLCACFGRVGRCMLRPIVMRSYSRSKHLSRKLVVTLQWWLQFLVSYTPRPVPSSLRSLPTVVSYSDGEGRLAGIGAALWHPMLPSPLAVYSEVPVGLRQYWASMTAGNIEHGYRDIFLVEALGPLLLLLTYPNYLRNCLWLHFIDNAGAESALIKGSSSNTYGGHVVGLTWQLVHRRCVWPYFDRVASKSNPVDGLSRRQFVGPWERVHIKPFPLITLANFASECGDDLKTW